MAHVVGGFLVEATVPVRMDGSTYEDRTNGNTARSRNEEAATSNHTDIKSKGAIDQARRGPYSPIRAKEILPRWSFSNRGRRVGPFIEVRIPAFYMVVCATRLRGTLFPRSPLQLGPNHCAETSSQQIIDS